MAGRSRLVALLAVASLLAVPALVLRVFCVGRSCDEAAQAEARVPFCSLPEDTRARVAAGFREGRSPEVLAVAGPLSLRGGSAFGPGGPRPIWPSTSGEADAARVPLGFSGPGVQAGATLQSGATLDSLAPSIAGAIGLERPHPEVRSGRPLDAIDGASARLVVEVVLKGIGSIDVERSPGAWPDLEKLLADGTFTMDADAGSLPLDPAAILATIGTGARPAQHGITGTNLRDDEGRLVRAWGPGAPVSVVATLADDLDEERSGEPKIGLVAPDPSDRGLIGGHWYVDVDRDDVTIGQRRAARTVRALLKRGYGRDAVPDLIAIVLDGSAEAMNAELGAIDAAISRDPRPPLVIVTATGSATPPAGERLDHRLVASWVERGFATGERIVEATTPGGLFLDQRILAREEISEDSVIDRIARMDHSGRRVFADVFPAIAVSFARYC
ncbi:MAG: hypothetical protein ACR2LG_02045 [Actinomycetota bacterium]